MRGATAILNESPAGTQPSVPFPWDQEISFVETEELKAMQGLDGVLPLVQELTSRRPDFQTTGSRDSASGQLAARNLPLLSADEERVLFRRMNYVKFQAEAIRSAASTRRPSPGKLERIDRLLQEAGEIRRTLTESNLRLVVALARKYAREPREFEENVSDGLLILLGAIEKFDYSRGFRFSTYATHAIRRHLFRVSRREQKQAQRFRPTAAEAMTELATAEESSEPSGRDAAMLYRQLMASVGDRLNEREESVLHRRFGTDGRRVTQTLREVAVDLGLSKERVRQIQIAALNKLKTAAQESNLLPTAG